MNMVASYPLVTSIVLCFKKFDNLYEAIASVLNQDYPCIELIISDDASGNFPEKAIRDFIEQNKKDNIIETKIIINETNLGTVRNYNAAIKAGTGEYYIGLSGDDVFFDSTVMRRIVERFEETGHEILSCRRLKCTEDELESLRLMPSDTYISIIKKLDTPEKQNRALVMGRFFEMASGSSTYFTRKHFEHWGFFDESYFLWEDGPFYTQYTRAGNIIPTAYDIISILYRDGGVSGEKSSSKMIKDYNRFNEVECYQRRDSFNKIDRRSISFSYQRSNKYYKCSKFKKILLYIKYFDVVIRGLCNKYFCLFITKHENRKFKNYYNK